MITLSKEPQAVLAGFFSTKWYGVCAVSPLFLQKKRAGRGVFDHDHTDHGQKLFLQGGASPAGLWISCNVRDTGAPGGNTYE